MDLITRCAHIALNMYNKIPLSLLNLLAPLYHSLPEKFRYGKTFCKQYHYLFDMEMMNEIELKKIENNLFLDVIRNAYENIPYYQNAWKNVEEIKSIDDITKLPFIDKNIIREHGENMISSIVNKRSLVKVATSGSTGVPLVVYQDADIKMWEWAYTNYVWSRVGYKSNSSRLVLRGKVFREQKLHGKNLQWDAFKRELSCNIFDMTEKNLNEYCNAIERYKPDFIHGYPSAIMLLAKYVSKHSLNHKFIAILATSETIYPEQKEYIEKILDARMFSFYGHTERLVMAAECETSTDYHVEPFYGYAEIIDSKGNVITKSREKGELVTTGFLNKSMPLIRYRTGDIAEWSDYGQCSCGRYHRRILRISGRGKQDILIKSDNSIISMTALNMHSDVFNNVLKYQFYQEIPGYVELRIVADKKYRKTDSEEIIRQIKEKVGKGLDISIIMKDDIPIGANGKYKLVEQCVEMENISGEISL